VKKMTGTGTDLALVSTGNEKALDQAFGSVRKGGKVLLFGAPAVGAQHRLDVSTLFSSQISLISSYSCVEPEMHEAIRLVSDKRSDVGSLISDRYKLEEAEERQELAQESGSPQRPPTYEEFASVVDQFMEVSRRADMNKLRTPGLRDLFERAWAQRVRTYSTQRQFRDAYEAIMRRY